MSAAVDRIAKVLAPYFEMESWVQDAPRLAARAAIKAFREPTDAMISAGCAAHPSVPYNAATTLDDIIRAEWQAMVDEALK